MDAAMESAVGPHFSGLRLDSRRLSSSSLPNSPSAASSGCNGTAPDAPAAVNGFAPPPAAASAEGSKQPFVIGVSGGTASGKTTVCDMIIQQLHDHRVVLVNQ